MSSKAVEILESWRLQAAEEWQREKYDLYPQRIIMSWSEPDPNRVLPEVSRIFMEE